MFVNYILFYGDNSLSTCSSSVGKILNISLHLDYLEGGLYLEVFWRLQLLQVPHLESPGPRGDIVPVFNDIIMVGKISVLSRKAEPSHINLPHCSVNICSTPWHWLTTISPLPRLTDLLVEEEDVTQGGGEAEAQEGRRDAAGGARDQEVEVVAHLGSCYQEVISW